MSKAVRPPSKSSVTATVDQDRAPKEPASGTDLMHAVLSKPSKLGKLEAPDNSRINGVVIGTLSGSSGNGQLTVDYPGNPYAKPVEAISTEKISGKDTGREVALSFVEGNPQQPVILGLVENPAKTGDTGFEEDVDVVVDGRRLTLTAGKEITLKCGKASITLTKAGKIIVKGAYLSNHSTGVNRIKGGSVQIN
jgi:hypothetical protein